MKKFVIAVIFASFVGVISAKPVHEKKPGHHKIFKHKKKGPPKDATGPTLPPPVDENSKN